MTLFNALSNIIFVLTAAGIDYCYRRPSYLYYASIHFRLRLCTMFLFKSKPPDYRSVLFVCTANVTRSPLAETLFRHQISNTGKTWEVASAGTKAIKGSQANPVVSFLMHQRGLPMSAHRSQPVTAKLLKKRYWIIVMELEHKDLILNIDPNLSERIFTFRELTNPNPSDESELDMPDPTGKNPDDYRELFEILDREMPEVVKIINAKTEDILWRNDEDKPQDG